MTSKIETHCNTEKSKYGTKVWAKGQAWNFNKELCDDAMVDLEATLERNAKCLDPQMVAHLISCVANRQ